jgi:hypothetical protein
MNNRWKSDASVADDDSFNSSQLDFTPLKSKVATNADVEDYGVIRFGQRYMLRGKLGKYLTAAPEEVVVNVDASKATTTGHTVPTSRTFPLAVEGQGVGDPLDCICFTNIENKYVPA